MLNRYSLECLLSLIEMVQFQNYIWEKRCNEIQMENDMEQVDCEFGSEFQFASNVPLSRIIEEQETIPEGYVDDEFMYFIKIKAYKIYNKYVKVGCEYEINISGTERTRIGNMLQNLDKLVAFTVTFKEMYEIFEVAKREMMILLEYSLCRLKSESGYATLVTNVSNSVSGTNSNETI